MLINKRYNIQKTGNFCRPLNIFFFRKVSLGVTLFVILFSAVSTYSHSLGLISQPATEVLNNINIPVSSAQFFNSGTVSKSSSSKHIPSSKQNIAIFIFKNVEIVSSYSTEKTSNTSLVSNKNISEILEKSKIESALTSSNLLFKNLPARQNYSEFLYNRMSKAGATSDIFSNTYRSIDSQQKYIESHY